MTRGAGSKAAQGSPSCIADRARGTGSATAPSSQDAAGAEGGRDWSRHGSPLPCPLGTSTVLISLIKSVCTAVCVFPNPHLTITPLLTLSHALAPRVSWPWLLGRQNKPRQSHRDLESQSLYFNSPATSSNRQQCRVPRWTANGPGVRPPVWDAQGIVSLGLSSTAMNLGSPRATGWQARAEQTLPASS